MEDMDERTAELTAQNAALNLQPPPSEATSSPTITNDAPPKVKSYPSFNDHHVEEITPDHHDHSDHHASNNPHIAFLQARVFDGTGRLSAGADGDSPAVERPTHGILRIDGDVVDSPMTSSLHLPADGSYPARAPTVNGNAALSSKEKVESLPLTAQTPQEIERLGSPDEAMTEKTGEAGLLPPKPERMDSIVPEGKGSKRLYQMSKRFSGSLIALYCYG